MHGTSQSIGFSSRPTGAEVTINNEPRGSTPIIVDLKRKDHHIIRITMDGYESYETTITRGVSGWVVGNLVFGALVGLAVDAISGGLYRLKPDEISAELQKSGGAVIDGQGKMFICVILEINPSWEKVGQLNPEL